MGAVCYMRSEEDQMVIEGHCDILADGYFSPLNAHLTTDSVAPVMPPYMID